MGRNYEINFDEVGDDGLMEIIEEPTQEMTQSMNVRLQPHHVSSSSKRIERFCLSRLDHLLEPHEITPHSEKLLKRIEEVMDKKQDDSVGSRDVGIAHTLPAQIQNFKSILGNLY